MPRNPSKARQSASQSSNTNVFQELRSLNSTADWLCHVVDSLDRKVDILTSTLPATVRAPQFARQSTPPRTGNQPERISSPLPTALLEAEYSPPLSPPPRLGTNLVREHNHYARLYNSVAQDGDFVLMPLRDASNHLVSSFPRTLARLAFIYGPPPPLPRGRRTNPQQKTANSSKCSRPSTSRLGASQTTRRSPNSSASTSPSPYTP